MSQGSCTAIPQSSVEFAEEESHYADFFSAYHTNQEPKVEANGTSVTWPAGWTPRRAQLWRLKHGLKWPNGPAKSHRRARSWSDDASASYRR